MARSYAEAGLTAATAAPAICPYCKQTLANKAAIEALREAEADYQERLKQAAAAEAARIVAERIQEVRVAEAKKADQWREKYEDLTERQKHAQAKLRLQLEKQLEEKAERKVGSRMRSLKQTLENAVEEKKTLERKLEQLTAAERGAFNEEDLVHELKQAFPEDRIEKRGKGGDILHEVFYRAGSERVRAGLIVYECKDTIQWDNAWVRDVKEAAEQRRTPHAVIVTRAFPPRHKDLVVRDDVPIVHPDRMTALIRVVRGGIIEIHRASLTAQGQAEKTMELYRYLTSDDFRQAFESLEEIGRQLKDHLEDEKKTHRRTWERREACYNELAEKTAVIDERIRGIIERPAGGKKAKIVRIPAS